MNAGAYESNISDFLMRLRVIELPSLVLTWLDQGAIDFEYRQSSGRLVFLWAEFLLQPSSPEECRRIIADTLAKRGKSQPIDKLSAGCIFKNPPKKHAGALIESLGLKGLASGGAEVSDIHANFIVNTGGATADNVYELIQIIKKAAKLHAGVDLELEVVLKGEFGGKMYL